MKIVSVDLETTGLAKDKNLQVLQAAFIIEDSNYPEIPVEELPTWSCFVRHPIYHNAGLNLKNYGLGMGQPDFKPVEKTASVSGISQSQAASVKQEASKSLASR